MTKAQVNDIESGTLPPVYDGSYIDGTSQETFNASLDAVLALLSSDNLGDCLYVECLRCKHRQPDKEFYLCEKCGNGTGLAHYEKAPPSPVTVMKVG